MAVARLVVGQPQPAAQAVRHARERRFRTRELIAAEQLERHAEAAQHLDIAARRVELGGAAKELQRPEAALLVRQLRRGAQLAQHVAAVFGQAHHAALVGRVALRGALAQHARQPHPLAERAVGADRQRRMALEQPLQGLQRNAGCGPRRRVTGGHLPRVGEARLQRRAVLPLQDDDVGAGTREVPGGGHADHAGAENRDSHLSFSNVIAVLVVKARKNRCRCAAHGAVVGPRIGTVLRKRVEDRHLVVHHDELRAQCSLTSGRVRRAMTRDSVSNATLAGRAASAHASCRATGTSGGRMRLRP